MRSLVAPFAADLRQAMEERLDKLQTIARQ
jgi:hypothetical protein